MEYKRTLNNYILIKLDKENTGIKLRNGFDLYVDTTFEPEKNCTVTGVVWGVPSKLAYTGTPNQNMPWLTTMEVNLGDNVILYYLSILNALKPQSKRYVLEGEDKYVFIEYQYIYAIVRGENIIPINGYCLIESIEDPAITREKDRMKALGMEMVVLDRRVSNQVTYGKIKYLGVPNRAYVDEFQSDRGVDVAIGDTVVIRKTNDIPLQYDLHQKVNQGVKLFRVHRRNLLAKI